MLLESHNSALSSYEYYFGTLKDPRDSRGLLHSLHNILIIAIVSVICGADDFTEMEDFGKSKEAFLKTFLSLPHGIPSHDTFGRVFSLLSPDDFRSCFIKWVDSLCDLNGEIINIDGKALRHSFDTATEKSMIHMVSAWANSNNMVLGQVKVSEKSNEITAIPELLKLLNLEGSLVTIDAMGTQKTIAAAIIDKKANYLLALKGNQSALKEEVIAVFETIEMEKGQNDLLINTSHQVDHGRVEERICSVLNAEDFISNKEFIKWKGLKSIIKIESHISHKNGKKQGKEEHQKRYYISSLGQEAQLINHAVQSHWGIETKLHWVLDVAFKEDDSRARKGHADENFAITRHIALNKLKKETSCKRGIKTKRKKAGWDNDYLFKVVNT